MRQTMKRLLVAGVMGGISHAGATAGNVTLTYPQIVERLYRMDLLAEAPVPGELSGNVSSFDRGSKYDAQKDRYVNWYANVDGSGYIRREGDGIVAAELEGPGVIWRIWSAEPKTGAIRIFIDGAETPVVDMPFSQLFDAEKGLFPCRELVRDMARGRNCFIPIPYQKSCKVVLAKGWGAYFQFTYTKFPAEWQVPSFRGVFTNEERSALAEADRIWAQRGKPGVPEAGRLEEITRVLKPGKSEKVLVINGPRAITGFMCSISGTDPVEMERALRELTLTITWDQDKQPGVWCPLGDFFGTAPGVNPFRSLPSGMGPDGMYASWYMPFGKKAVLSLANDGQTERTVVLKVVHVPLTKPAASLLRFHAKWHRDHFGRNGVGRYGADRWPDWPILLSNGGAGRFCGVALHIWNPLHSWDKKLAAQYVKKVSDICPVPDWFKSNVMGNYWWGEGDEKFFVDGEKFPSTFGTGSEDYFGYAWGTPKVFDSATQCQTRNGHNIGHLSMVRFHIADNVPFHSTFEACIEKYHGNNWPLLYAATVYWYQAAGVSDEYLPIPLNERVDYYVMPENSAPVDSK